MIGLILSEVILFMAVGLLGFAIGYSARSLASSRRMADERRDVEYLRSALSEAQVRRARIS
ncbi:MAG TPA: hypothetical protein VFO00_04720 [Vitreimonas sp.]|nr:hypothetical protein [Vitreimonas sp.]